MAGPAAGSIPIANDPEQTFSAVQEATAARLTCWYFCPQLFGAALLIGQLVGRIEHDFSGTGRGWPGPPHVAKRR
jgi:hypothetical protein